MALNKIKTSSIEDDSITSVKLAPGAVTNADIPNSEITMDKLSQVDLTIAPEVLEIQVDAPAAGQDSAWLWTWLTSSLPYARRTITNSPEISVPLYKQGTYTVNNYAAYDLHGSMTQTHTLYFKWIDGAGTDNLISWATSTGPVSDSHPDINGGAATNVQRINIAVPGTVTPPTLTAPNVSYTVTNNGTGAYTFSGSASGDNPNIGPFYRGGTYTFNVSAVGHPLYFTTDNGTNFSAGTYFGEYTTGVTGSRTDNGTVTITVDASAPNTLYYQCGNHSSMRGVITVKDLAVETNINGNYIVYAQHTQEGHKTPIEIRPIPSLVNQMCLVYDATSGKFVPQDLATYVENTPSFENKIREVAGTAELVVEDGSAVIAKVNVYDDSTYLPLVGNNPGDQAFATDTDILYIWDGSAWQQAGAANTDDLAEGSTNLFYTDARVGSYLTAQGYDTATNIIASITDSAPVTLDTLNELAAALGDDPNFATTVTNSIATKLPLAGGTLSGKLTLSDLGNATISALQFGDSGLGISSPTTDQLNFISADATRLIIESGGNTVIRPGTTYSSSSSTATSSNIPLYVESVAGVNAGAPPTSGSTPDASMALRLQSGGNFNAALDFGVGGGGGAYIQYHNRADYTTHYNLHLQPNGGNIGIGNTSPNRPLTVTANSGANALALRRRSADDYAFIQFFNNAGSAVTSQIYNHNDDIKFAGGASSDANNNFAVTSDNTITLPKKSSDPTGANGDMYYNTTLGAPRVKTTDGWVSFGVALGTQANPLTSVGQAQSNNISSGLHWFQNSSGQTQELYYDSGDGGWIMVSSNNANSTTIPSGNGRHDLAYTIRRNGTMGALGTASPDNDYLIGGWVDNFSWTRARLVGFGRGSTNGTYSWSNLGTYINCQFNASGWANVVTLANVSISGTSSVYTQNSGYWTVDGIQADYNNGGFAANPNQTTIGMVGVAASDGDPDSGCYMGHGNTEGHYEGWYDSGGGAADCQGYTTWVR